MATFFVVAGEAPPFHSGDFLARDRIKSRGDEMDRRKRVPLFTITLMIASFCFSSFVLADSFERSLNYATQGKFREAEKEIRRALKTDVDIQMGESGYGLPMFLEIIEDANRGKISKEHALYLFKGVKYATNEQYQQAITEFQKALRLNFNYAQNYYSLGVSHFNLGQFQEAATYFKKTIQIKPNYAEARANLGLIQIFSGQILEAKENLQRAKELFLNKGDYQSVQFVEEILKTSIEPVEELFDKAKSEEKDIDLEKLVGVLEDDRILGNEESASVTLRALSTAFQSYYYSNKNIYPNTLSELANAKPPYIDSYLAEGSPYMGYKHKIVDVSQDSYLIVAYPDPSVPAKLSGRYSFCIMEDGIVRINRKDGRINSRDVCKILPEFKISDEERSVFMEDRETIAPSY